jgi:hypothetical protein
MLSSRFGMLPLMGARRIGSFGIPHTSKKWKTFDVNHRGFANDPRNVRLTDEMNPFGDEEPTQYMASDSKPIQYSFMVGPYFWFEAC